MTVGHGLGGATVGSHNAVYSVLGPHNIYNSDRSMIHSDTSHPLISSLLKVIYPHLLNFLERTPLCKEPAFKIYYSIILNQ